MSNIKTPYEDLLKSVLVNGVYKEDRTGTGTHSLFGAQMRFDLRESFPLITTKKVNFHAVVGELLWFLRGSTNNQWLKENGVNIWNEWADEYGQLGSIYGAQWRNWYRLSDELVTVEVQERDNTAGRGEWKDESSKVKFDEDYALPFSSLVKKYPHINPRVIKMWRDKINKASLSTQWRDIEKFSQGISCAPGFALWYSHPDKYELCTEYFGTLYLNKESAMFLPVDYAREIKNAHDNREPHDRHKFDSTEYTDSNGKKLLLRKKVTTDQIANIVDTIKNNPDSRRIILNAWNVGELDNMALPPCHAFFQFYVENGKVSGMLTQRSADLFLGVPFNIASYALLIHMVARLTGLEVGELIWSGGDCHIYANHLEQVETQLKREPYAYPTIKFHNDPNTPLWNYDFKDIEVVGYQSHPFIKAPVAV